MTTFRDRATQNTKQRGYFDAEDVVMSVDIIAVIGAVVNLKHGGGEQRGLCPFHPDRSPSLVVVPKMGKNGLWRCYGCSDRWDDVIGFVRKLKGCDFRGACQYLVGDQALEFMDKDRERLKAEATARQKREDEEAEKTRRSAYALWERARPIANTPAELYLRARGITVPLPGTLRFESQLRCEESKQDLPAMVAAFVDAKGTFMALHRTWLARGLDRTWKKAALDNPKKTLARYGGGAIRLHPPQASQITLGATLYVAEGIETALSVLAGLRRRPHLIRNAAVWAAGSLTNMSRLALPNDDDGTCLFSTVVLCVDADSAEANVKAETINACTNYEPRGCDVKVAWPVPGQDFNDMVQASTAQGADPGDQVAQFLQDHDQFQSQVTDPTQAAAE